MTIKSTRFNSSITHASLKSKVLPRIVGRTSPWNILSYNGLVPTTTNPKFGTKSLEFNQTNQYFRISPFTNTALNGSDFTVETWLWFNVMPRTITNGGGSYATLFFGQSTSSPTAAGIEPYILLSTSADAAENPQVQFGTQSLPGGGSGVYFTYLDYGTSLEINTWYHFAVCRINGVWAAYWNGVPMTRTGATPPTTSPPIRDYGTWGYWLGTGRGPMNGYFDEIRVSNRCRYSGPFTPPSEPFVNDDATLLLIHANGDAVTDDLN